MLDGRSLLNAILDAAEAGAEGALNQIAADARRRAPVRKLFKGGYKRKFRGPVGVNNQNVAGAPYSMAVRFARVATSSGQYPLVSDQGNYSRQNAQVPSTRKLKVLNGGRIMGTSDHTFREVRKIAKGTFGFETTKVRYRVGGHMRLLDLRDEFLARAAYDVSKGRGITKVAGQEQYGGTLRESIQVIGPERHGTDIVGYVQASATEHGFNYAYAQEFGTAHNRPQPFLRPAARSVFRRIKNDMSNSMTTHLAKIRPGHIRLVPAVFKIVATSSRSFNPRGSNSVVTIVNNSVDRAFAIR